MMRVKKVIGIDVASESLTISIYDGKVHDVKTLNYTKSDIRKILIRPFIHNKEDMLIVMEGTGVYHTRVAHQLASEDFKVCVINPLIIKRYVQMHLSRIKTDKSDAKLIAEYGYEYQHKLSYFIPKKEEQIHIDNLIKALDDLLLQKGVCTSQLHALTKQVNYAKEAAKSYQRHQKFLQQEIGKLETYLDDYLSTYFSDNYRLLQSIPGVGLKISATILSAYGSFENFQSAKQACSFAGMAPSLYESGTSVKGKSRISKRGNPFIRKMLFMGALSATTYNPLVRQYYRRLIANGKPKMSAMNAAAHKLLRIIFGVLKSEQPFDVNYVRSSNI
jgi:transposase